MAGFFFKVSPGRLLARTSESLRSLGMVWAAALAAIPFLPSGCARDDVLVYSPLRPAASARCEPCHAEIYREWEESLHARAWSRPSFQEGLAATGTPACWPCHAPAAYQAGGAAVPSLRESNLSEGVNCAACHGADCPYVRFEGAEEGESSAPVPADPAERCGLCHAETLKEYRAYSSTSPSPIACVDCHLPPRANAPGPEYSAGGNPHRDHAGRVRESAKVFIEIPEVSRASAEEIELSFYLHNRNTGHCLPTGRFGWREIRLEAWVDDPAGGSLKKVRFFAEMGTALAPGRNGPYYLRMPSGGEILYARVLELRSPIEEGRILGEFSESMHWVRGRN